MTLFGRSVIPILSCCSKKLLWLRKSPHMQTPFCNDTPPPPPPHTAVHVEQASPVKNRSNFAPRNLHFHFNYDKKIKKNPYFVIFALMDISFKILFLQEGIWRMPKRPIGLEKASPKERNNLEGLKKNNKKIS